LVAGGAGAETDARAEFGRLLFFDATLSEPAGQSCASCHDPAAFMETLTDGYVPQK
jgi:cytochrome c peroxidase